MQKYYYLIQFQFLGFRYHGWQKQTNAKTVQGMLERTLCFVLGHDNFRTLGASRTDKMVSANHGAFELFTRELLATENLLHDLNQNLPPDIKILSIEEVGKEFNIIQHPKTKEYLYLFSFGEKNHPFCAPFMVYIQQELDVEMMKKGAKIFEGRHNFKRFCYKPNEKTVFEREIFLCEIVENDQYTASFFPEQSYMLRIRSQGFLRHQVRFIMASLFELGQDQLSLEQIKSSFLDDINDPLVKMAPSSGLILNQVIFTS